MFVTSDILCIFVQLAGGALFGVTAGKDPSEGGIDADTATNVLMAGLILQVSRLPSGTSRRRDRVLTETDRRLGHLYRFPPGRRLPSVPVQKVPASRASHLQSHAMAPHHSDGRDGAHLLACMLPYSRVRSW